MPRSQIGVVDIATIDFDNLMQVGSQKLQTGKLIVFFYKKLNLHDFQFLYTVYLKPPI